MKELVVMQDKQAVTSTLNVARDFEREHYDVIKSVENLRKDVGTFTEMFFETVEPDFYGRDRKVYLMNRDGFTLLAMGFNGKKALKFKLNYINAFNKMEEKLQQPKLPATYKEALLALVEAEEEKERLEQQNAINTQIIGELQPKANYTDIVLQAKNAITITQIAKDYGISGRKMNELLHELRVQYKQSGQWLLYAEYAHEGYTESDTFYDTRGHARINTKWTQKGRLFIYDLLKNEKNMLPTIEQDSGKHAFGENKILSMI